VDGGRGHPPFTGFGLGDSLTKPLTGTIVDHSPVIYYRGRERKLLHKKRLIAGFIFESSYFSVDQFGEKERFANNAPGFRYSQPGNQESP